MSVWLSASLSFRSLAISCLIVSFNRLELWNLQHPELISHVWFRHFFWQTHEIPAITDVNSPPSKVQKTGSGKSDVSVAICLFMYTFFGFCTLMYTYFGTSRFLLLVYQVRDWFVSL
jgi:hypothetical protein